jgi:hypothetical protein
VEVARQSPRRQVEQQAKATESEENKRSKDENKLSKDGKKLGGNSKGDEKETKRLSKSNNWMELMEMDLELEVGECCVKCGIVITKGRIRVEFDSGPVHLECTDCMCGKDSEVDEVIGVEVVCKGCGAKTLLDSSTNEWVTKASGTCKGCKREVTKEQMCYVNKVDRSWLHVECKSCTKCEKRGRKLMGERNIVCECGYTQKGVIR